MAEPTWPNPEIPRPHVPWEDKHSPLFKNWLSDNANLLPKDWSTDFSQYVEKRVAEWNQRLERNRGKTEHSDQEVFAGYLKRLDMHVEQLKGKRILDFGCREGAFVRACIDQGITSEAYGIDKALHGKAASNEYAGHFYTGDYHGPLPVSNIDIGIFKASLHMALREKGGVEKAVATLVQTLDELTPRGEVRIGPIIRRLIGPYPDDDYNKVQEMLELLSQLRTIQYELVPVEIGAWDRQDPKSQLQVREVVLDSVLIIKNVENS